MDVLMKIWRKIKPLFLEFLGKLWPILLEVAEEILKNELTKKPEARFEKDRLMMMMKFELSKRGIEVSNEKINEAIGLAIAQAMTGKNGDGKNA